MSITPIGQNNVSYHEEIRREEIPEQDSVNSANIESPRSSVAYFLGSSQKAKISLPLSVPREIIAQLNQQGIVVVFGAPASGKSEQMELAIPSSEIETFDLSARFPEAYSLQTGREKEEIAREYQLNGSQAQKELKEAQKHWLQEENQAIIDELAASTKPIIVFDEFDFSADFFLSADEADSAVSIVKIGESLRKLGKQVVFIIHSAANTCQPFWDSMESSFGYQKSETVKTRFFTKSEEIYLLSQTSLNPDEKQEFMSIAQGSPTAYLPILKHKKDVSLQLLKDQATLTSSLVIKFTKQTIRPDVWELLVGIAQEKVLLEEIDDPILIEHLLSSSFVGEKEGRLVMNDFAKAALCQ